jgi:hypothetical protein
VAGAIDRVLVAGRVLADPIIPASVSEHGAPPGSNKCMMGLACGQWPTGTRAAEAREK